VCFDPDEIIVEGMMPFVEDRLGTPKGNEWRYDLIAAKNEKDAEIAALKNTLRQVNVLFNPCGHTGLESNVCDICGYPQPTKYIAALKERVKELEAANAKYKAALEKYQAFWEDSRMVDKMQWEQYDWPKRREASKDEISCNSY